MLLNKLFVLCIALNICSILQVRVCREKTTGHVYAMKKLKKSEMLRRGQVRMHLYSLPICFTEVVSTVLIVNQLPNFFRLSM